MHVLGPCPLERRCRTAAQDAGDPPLLGRNRLPCVVMQLDRREQTHLTHSNAFANFFYFVAGPHPRDLCLRR